MSLKLFINILRNKNRICSTFDDAISNRASVKGFSTRSAPLTNTDVKKLRNELFDEEKECQKSLISRVEKITVEHVGPPENCTLLMNKNISTPFSCAMHIQELLMKRSALALVNGKPWDMHRPLEQDCILSFLHFKDEDPLLLNEAFWRTGSFLLGYVLENVFKDDFFVELCSFPRPNIRSGSFVYDVDLKVNNWKPTKQELMLLGRAAFQLTAEDLRFERLEVDASKALKMFAHNRFKTAQIPAMAAQSLTGSTICLYRVAEHIDICRGPLIASTNQIGRFVVSTIHPIESPDLGPLSRVQGFALPTQTPVHFWTANLLEERAAILNTAPLPQMQKMNSYKLPRT